jgi:hypothetical protein
MVAKPGKIMLVEDDPHDVELIATTGKRGPTGLSNRTLFGAVRR